jgi:hypothetical protein
VWLSAFGRLQAGKAVLTGFMPGLPTKVVIHPDAGTHPEVQVRGVECASGQALHFCYRDGGCGFTGAPVFGSQLGHEGDDVVTIAADQHTDDTGYMLFQRSGKYMITVTAGSHVLGTVTLQVV